MSNIGSEYLLRRITELERTIGRLILPEIGPQPVFLQVPLTSTAWDGDAKTTGNNGIIDLSAVFGVPAGVKAIIVLMKFNDETANVQVGLGPSSTHNDMVSGDTIIANQEKHVTGTVTCDANGDVYWGCSDEIDNCTIKIYGYYV